MLKRNNYKFLINTITDWNEPPRARHQVAYALAKTHPVKFITANRFGLPRLILLRVSNNLEVITPYFPIDSRIRIRIAFINKIYQKWLYKRLRINYRDYYVINFDFTARYLFLYFKDAIYYCNDDHIKLSYKLNMTFIARYQDKSERLVAEKSKFCIGTSKFLVNKLKQYNSKSYEIRLGAPTIDFVQDTRCDRETKTINVGFVGFIKTIDYKLINFLLSKDEINFTLIGPINPKIQKSFEKYKNVRITGKLSGIDLYKEVGKFDVGIIPYNIDVDIDRTPNKLWLYLALGVPTVISNIKSIRDWEFPEKFIYLSNNNNEFHEKILKAYEEDNTTLKAMRAEFAKNNSWDLRVQELCNICEANFNNSKK